MAIDDNTSYELTGAQVKDLASKINAKEDSADLAAVAESGSYNDLLDKPTIPAAQVNSDWDAASGVAQILNKPSLATVATSGSYSDLSNKPTIGNATITIQKNGTSAGTFTTNATSNKSINITVPTATSDLTNDSGFITGIPTASTTTLGGIKVGDNLSIDANGVLSADADSVWTNHNLSPAANTPASWKTLLGGEGIYWTWYNTADKFTNQPNTYGFLRTVIGGSDIRQDFYTQTNGQHYYRTGNGTGWYGTSGDGGVFRYLGSNIDSALSTTSNNPVRNSVVTTKINEIDRFYRGLVPLGTEITADKDLNTVEFLSVGKYYCSKNVTVATLTNCPTSTAFMMEVFSPLSTTIDNETTGTWVYRMRLITELDGDMWYQGCNSNGTANNWTYNAWHKIARIDDIDAKPNSYWGTCATAADVAAKVVTVSSSQNFKLVPGAMITFALSASNTAENPTINVNNTGAKQVKYNSAVITTGSLNRVGYNTRPTTFVYDGTYWVWVSWSVDDDTTYSAMSVAEGEAGTATTARTMRADRLKQIIEYYNPTNTSDLVNDGSNGTSTYVEANQLATVATSGSYNDLSDKPTITTVNDATLTIQRNGTDVQTFTANSSTNKTANIQVPNLQTSNTDPGEGAALAADTFLGVYDVAPSAIDGSRITNETITPDKTTFTTYSATEKAVGKWIDGKTIYRKTVDVGALPNNTIKNVAHGISNLDTVIDCRGFAKATWGTQYPIQTVYASGDAGYNTQVSVDATNIVLSCTGNNSSKSGYVTIWYTKSS